MAQIINITSEALQATIRRLLPSQQGFGEDLQASNVIQPVIDLTPTAEGSQLETDLARALNFGDATPFEAENSSATIASTPGFYRVIGTALTIHSANNPKDAFIAITDGSTTKQVWTLHTTTANSGFTHTTQFDFNLFIDTGESVTAVSEAAVSTIAGSIRQIADRYGNILNPTGFTFE